MLQSLDRAIETLIPAFVRLGQSMEEFKHWLENFSQISIDLRRNFEKTLTPSERLRYHALLLTGFGWLDAADVIEREERYYGQE